MPVGQKREAAAGLWYFHFIDLQQSISQLLPASLVHQFLVMYLDCYLFWIVSYIACYQFCSSLPDRMLISWHFRYQHPARVSGPYGFWNHASFYTRWTTAELFPSVHQLVLLRIAGIPLSPPCFRVTHPGNHLPH